MLNKKFMRIYAVSLLFSFFFIFYAGTKNPKTLIKPKKEKKVIKENEDKLFERNLTLFIEVISWVKKEYVKDFNYDKLFLYAINGMLGSLDPHSMLLTPSMMKELNEDTSGEFGGLGMHITVKDGVLTIIAPIVGTPAYKAGLKPWDRITEINGEPTDKMTLLEAVRKLKGKPGTKVTITIVRRGVKKPLKFTITRDIIKIQRVFKKMVRDDIGYIRLSEFSEGCSDEIKKAISSLKKEGMKALIFDLRNNPGGLLSEAVKVCDLFLPSKQLVVYTKGRAFEANKKYYTKNSAIFKGPMVILVNSGSASASEIVTGCLQDLHRAIIIGIKGHKTFGKGSVQTVIPLTTKIKDEETGTIGDGALKLTIAKYYTPKGRAIEDIHGITPDIGVYVSEAEEEYLQKHGLLGEPSMEEKEYFDKKKQSKKVKKEKSNKHVEKYTDFTTKMLEALNGPAGSEEDKNKMQDSQLQKGIEICKILLLANNEK